jgi:hypothetical protein
MVKTLFRAVVMVATGVIVVKGWQLYGPTNEQVKVFAVNAMEKTQTAWHQWGSETPAPQSLANDPRPQAAPLNVPSLSAEQMSAPAFAGTAAPPTAPALTAAPPLATEEVSQPEQGEPDKLPALFARLEEIGCSEPQLGAWGTSGQLYRCSCQAQVGDSAFVRHFEAVAEEPVAAVEQVVAYVEAWQAEQKQP